MKYFIERIRRREHRILCICRGTYFESNRRQVLILGQLQELNQTIICGTDENTLILIHYRRLLQLNISCYWSIEHLFEPEHPRNDYVRPDAQAPASWSKVVLRLLVLFCWKLRKKDLSYYSLPNAVMIVSLHSFLLYVTRLIMNVEVWREKSNPSCPPPIRKSVTRARRVQEVSDPTRSNCDNVTDRHYDRCRLHWIMKCLIRLII
jgi:hypothetical protein